MSYASKLGHAKIDPRNPRAAAVCDRCGFVYNHYALRWQYDFRGRTLANLRILVCEQCTDEVQPQLKPRILPPDPVAIENARVERWQEYSTNTRIVQGNSVDFFTGIPITGGGTRITQTSNTRVTQTTGEPPYGYNEEPGTNFQVPGDGDLGPEQGLPYGFDQIPKTGPLNGNES